jgi:hypothetical protein
MGTIVGQNGVAINPETGHPNHRTTPEHKFLRAYARDGMVVVVGKVGDQEVENEITRREAISRATAVNDMVPKTPYSDDAKEYSRIVEQLMKAIHKARDQDGGRYTSARVSMAMASTDPRSPLFANTSSKGSISPMIGDEE